MTIQISRRKLMAKLHAVWEQDSATLWLKTVDGRHLLIEIHDDDLFLTLEDSSEPKNLPGPG